MTMRAAVALVALFAAALAVSSRAQVCGRYAGGALCGGCQCCSEFGFCGSTEIYCGARCQSQCNGCSGGGGEGVASIISEGMFDTLLKNRNDVQCKARDFYTYSAFITAAEAFPGFGNTGSTEVRQREIAAFLAQTGYETTGGWDATPDGSFTWGYCNKEEKGCDTGTGGAACDYCNTDWLYQGWPCAPGKQYYGRGPMQLSYNYNYGKAGQDPAIGEDLLRNPELVAQDPVISFKTAIWFWMTPQGWNKPSCHDVITGLWNPSPADAFFGRLPGYGVITNIINGGPECGKGYNEQASNRTFFYTSYCQILGVSPGDYLDCYKQRDFDSVFLPAGATTATLENHADA